jgi:hypothetical protein
VDITPTIRRPAMEYIPGTMAGSTKVILRMTIAMVTDSSIIHKESCSIKDSGRMGNNLTKKSCFQTDRKRLDILHQGVVLVQVGEMDRCVWTITTRILTTS